MAKRKKKSGGGGFGGGARPGPDGPVHLGHNFEDPERDLETEIFQSEASIKIIQKALISQGLKSPEELEKFLNERFIGKPLDELAEEFLGGPKTDLDRADDLMDGLDEDASPAEIRSAAEKALKLSPYCIAAWLVLANQEDDPGKALEILDQGIEKGRVRYDGLIESLEEGQGIWGWIEARDFMRLLHERALALEVLGNFEEATTAYQEMLALNPPDQQGARGDLFRLLVVFRKIDEAWALATRFSDSDDVVMAYGRALLGFVMAMDRTGFDMSKLNRPGAPKSPPETMKRLGPEFDAAKRLMKQALKTNPFVPWIMTHPQVMEADGGEFVLRGGPWEALHYSRKWAYLWLASGLPFVALTAAMDSNPQRHLKTASLQEEFLDVFTQLDSFDGEPWWEQFDAEDS